MKDSGAEPQKRSREIAVEVRPGTWWGYHYHVTWGPAMPEWRWAPTRHSCLLRIVRAIRRIQRYG